MLPEKGYKRIIVICFYILLAAAICFLFFNYVFKWLWPIFIAAAIGILLQPVVRFLTKKLKFGNKFASVLTVIILYLAVGYLVGAIITKVITEVSTFAGYIPNYLQKLNIDINEIKRIAGSFLKKIHINVSSNWLDGVFSQIWNAIQGALSTFSSNMIANLPGIITKVAQIVPSALLAIVIMIVSSVYFASDYSKIKNFIKIQFSDSTVSKITATKNHIVDTVIKYLRAYLLIMLITAVELYLGFSIMGQNYALLLALVISVIDILPVLGIGTVLIPWGVILLIMGNTVKGIEILVMYVIITVIRQIIEPRIVGKYIGLHPLVTLVAMYAGLRSCGLLGMFLFPITVIILQELNSNGSIHLWKNAPAEEKVNKKSLKDKLKNKLMPQEYKAKVSDCENTEDSEGK